ncbi:putative ribonuclease H-like domain-containing protein [Tanacetum coccineum]
MALPNEHQLTFSQYIDAKSMFAAIETRFGESLDSIFNRLQKIVSRLAILGVVIAQEDLNLIFLSSLPPEWNTYVVVWMNKPEVDTMSIDDLYNNFKIVKQKVKKSIGASSGAQNLAFMTAPSTGISTVSPNVNTASPQVSTASLSDNVVYAFMVENPNGSDLLHQDIEKIREDDLEAMDLKWECRAPRSKEGQFRNQDNTKKQGNNEDTSSKAMLAIKGVGFDWSDMAEEQVQINMALMEFSDSECDDLIVEFKATTYKRGLATLEEQLITYRKNEVLFSEEVTVLKREVACKDYEINMLKSKFEKVKQEKEDIEFKIKKFDKASKDLQLLGSQIIDKSKNGLGYSAVPPPHPLIYNRPKKLDLSYSSLDEFKEPEVKGFGTEYSKQVSNIVCDKKLDDSTKSSDESLVKEQVSKDTSSFVESSLNVDKEIVFPIDKKVESVKPKNHEKPAKKSVRYAEMYRSQTPRGNQRNWNGQKSNQLGSDFVMYTKACFICGSFNHVQAQCKYHQREGMVYRNTYKRVNYNYTTKRTHPNAQRNMIPRVVLMKISLKTFNTARSVNTAHSKSTVFSAKPIPRFSKPAQLTVRRPFQTKTALNNKRFTQAINTAKAQVVNTARPKVVKTARPNFAVVNAVRVNQENVVKASACWGKPQQDDTTFVDSGCSRHMTGHIAYLSVFKEFDRGYVSFGGGAHGGRITDCLQNILKMTKPVLLVLKGSNTGFTWVFFLTTKDETSEILKNFIKEIENLVDKKVKIIRSDNGIEFKNKVMDDFCREKGIKMEYSAARTPQQNGVAERRNRTLIEAARTTTASSLEAEQDSGSGPRCQDTILGDVDAQTRFKTTSKQSNDTPLSRGYTLGSGEDSMKLLEIMKNCKFCCHMRREGNDFSGRITHLFETMMVQPTQDEGVGYRAFLMILIIHTLLLNRILLDLRKYSLRRKQSGEDSMQLSELMLLCTNLQKQVLDLEKAKDAQAKEIAALKKRVQKLERKKKSRTGRSIEDIDKDDDVSLVDDTQGRSDNEEMFDINDLHSDEVNVDMPVGEKQEQSEKEREVDTSVEDSAAPITIEEITLAQTLIQIKAAKPKVRKVRLDEEKEEDAKIALIESWDITHAMMEADFELALEANKQKIRRVTIEKDQDEKAKGGRKKILGKKRAGKEQQQESSKRQRIEDDKETDEHEEVEVDDEAELKKHLVIVKDDDIAIDAIPLATKPPVIVEYKLLKEGIMAHYELIRADHGDIRPEDEHERVLWGDLKVMFEPDIKSDVLETILRNLVEYESRMSVNCVSHRTTWAHNQRTTTFSAFAVDNDVQSIFFED